MIPYYQQPQWNIGPLTIHLFGVLVAIGILVGTHLSDRRTIKMGLDANITARMVIWVIVGGFVGAHLVESIFYSPAATWENPIRLLKVWQGISSFGGFLGSIMGAWLFIRRERMRVERWYYLDAIVYAFPFAWLFGRSGCAVAHDHRGIYSSFPLAVQFPEGARLDLGLLEALLTILWIAVAFFTGRKARAPGFMSGIVAATYAPVRFFLDFFRTEDDLYFGLTPGQYGAIGLFLLGIWLMYHSRSLSKYTLVPREAAAKASTGGPAADRTDADRTGDRRIGKKRPKS